MNNLTGREGRIIVVTMYNTIKIDSLNIFYREAGPTDAPVIVLLHGFPSSSHMYRDLITALKDDYHLIAPDYPGFGNSDRPLVRGFAYTFDHLAEVMEKFLSTLGLKKFSLYMQDYGGPIGFRIAAKHPDWIEALIIQNTNAYEEGLTPLFERLRPLWEKRTGADEWRVIKTFGRAGTVWQYTQGARDKRKISPDAWNMDQYFLERPHSHFIQLELQADFGSNLKRYPEWHDYFRKHQPPTLVVWGKNDKIFSPQGAEMYKRDLKNIEVHMLDTGHFAIEEDCDVIAEHMRRFLKGFRLKKAV
jgi:pimeloyl-ACP methyl ester carboxylesterase